MSKPKRKRHTRPAAKPRAIQPVWLAVSGVGLVAILLLGLSLIRQSESSVAENLPLEISAAQALERREAGAFMLDVREPDEWNDYHIPGATLIPLGELSSRVDDLPRDQEIVVVCRSGNRSAAGRDILLEAGFSQVTSMGGGMIQWQAAGYPTTSGP